MRIRGKIIIAVCVAAMVVLSGLLIAACTEDVVNCWITMEPAKDHFEYGETICLVAHIDYFELVDDDDPEATPTYIEPNDLVWIVKWQRCEGDQATDEWIDIAYGFRYEFVLTEETALSWYRFVATTQEQ